MGKQAWVSENISEECVGLGGTVWTRATNKERPITEKVKRQTRWQQQKQEAARRIKKDSAYMWLQRDF